jgi:hypothetical protein
MPHYTTRADGAAAVLRVAVSVGDSVPRAGRDVAAAIGISNLPGAGSGPPIQPPAPAEFRARVAALYDAMQSALQRGDLAAFGSAYDALGTLLGRPRPARSPRP